MVRFILPPVSWMIVIFIFSSRTKLHVSDIFTVQFAFFKALHIIEYAFLYLLWYRGLKNTTTLSMHDLLLVTFIITVGYAITDEIHQTLVPTREGKMRDIAIDIIGAFCALGFVWKLIHHAPQKLKNWARNWHLL